MLRARLGSRTGPGTPGWTGLHSRLGGSFVLLGSRDPGNGQSGRCICRFLAVLLYTSQYQTISNKTRKVECHNIEGPVRTALLLRNLEAPTKEGPANIFMYMCIYILICMYKYAYIYIYVHTCVYVLHVA